MTKIDGFLFDDISEVGYTVKPVQTVIIVDESFNYHALEHELSCTVIDYDVVWTCSNLT